MSLRSALFCAAVLACLGSTSASAGPITITSYDVKDDDGRRGGHHHGDNDFLYAEKTGRLVSADGVAFHLTPGQTVGSISLYVEDFNPLFGDWHSPVVTPRDVLLTVNGKLISTTFSLTAVEPNVDKITLAGFSISSSSVFDLELIPRAFRHDGFDDHNQHGSGFNPDRLVDNPDSPFTVGFRDHDRGDRDHDFRPWLVLGDVEFFASAVPEPSTWVLMITGLAGLYFVARWRRNRQLVALP